MSPQQSVIDKNRRSKSSIERLSMFSDGVFAIAITLLVLEIKVPSHDDLLHAGGLSKYLMHLWPHYLSYIFSFIFVGIYWVNHHWLFGFVKKTDHVYNLINLLFLMTIAFAPFPSAILGDYMTDAEYKTEAVTMGCIGFALPVIPILLGHLYATYNNRLVAPDLSRKFINSLTMKLGISFAFSCVTIGLSYSYPNASLWIIVILLLIFLLPPDPPVYDAETGRQTH